MRPGSSSTDARTPLPEPSSLELAALERIPITLVSGFLGSGKSTLINRWLRNANARDTAVIVNEFGEIGLDHLIVEHASEDTVLLANGCLCCSVQSDLVSTLRSLMERRELSALPHYRRVIVETSGLADCAPVMQTLMSDPLRLSAYDLHEVVVTVDSVLAMDTLNRFEQARRQVAMADRLLISKTSRTDAVAEPVLTRALESLSRAPIDIADSASLHTGHNGWKRTFPPSRDTHVSPSHNHGITTLVKRFDTPIRTHVLQCWLAHCVEALGDRLLRVKGLVSTLEHDSPLVIHCVQHVVERPEPLAYTCNLPRRGWLEFIVEASGRQRLMERLDALDAETLDDGSGAQAS